MHFVRKRSNVGFTYIHICSAVSIETAIKSFHMMTREHFMLTVSKCVFVVCYDFFFVFLIKHKYYYYIYYVMASSYF